MAKAKKETLKQAFEKYEKSAADKAEDMKGARKLQKRDNAKVKAKKRGA